MQTYLNFAYFFLQRMQFIKCSIQITVQFRDSVRFCCATNVLPNEKYIQFVYLFSSMGLLFAGDATNNEVTILWMTFYPSKLINIFSFIICVKWKKYRAITLCSGSDNKLKNILLINVISVMKCVRARIRCKIRSFLSKHRLPQRNLYLSSSLFHRLPYQPW